MAQAAVAQAAASGPMGPMRLYVLVRRDLSPSQQTVQAAHAVAEFMLHNGHDPAVRKWAGDDRYLVALGVAGLAELEEWERLLSEDGVLTAAFSEPDMGGEKTALAAHPAADRRLFRKLRLL